MNMQPKGEILIQHHYVGHLELSLAHNFSEYTCSINDCKYEDCKQFQAKEFFIGFQHFAEDT